jgi:transcriptional regulator with XRE-family HTH domain
MDGSIGERIRQLRYQRTPRMTQRDLAERAGVSVDLISKLEQGAKHSALVRTLRKIASALDVDAGTLLAGPQGLAVADDDGGVLAVREAITALWETGDPGDLEELRQSARYAWACYWTAKFDVLGGLLPGFIATARATARETSAPGAHAALSDAYGVAASMLVHLGHLDLAYLGMERAIVAAERSQDELRHAAMSGWMSWLLLHQTGSQDGVQDPSSRRAPLTQARQLAVQEADQIEPKLGKAPAEHISVWGSLLISAAVAAARDGQPGEADDILNLAEAAATRLDGTPPGVRLAYQSSFGMPLVVMQTVDVSVVTDRPARALKVSERMPQDSGLPLASKARHLADVAYARTRLGHDREAVEVLLEIERAASEWMRYQAYPRTIVRELLERERRARTPQLRGLAARLNVA